MNINQIFLDVDGVLADWVRGVCDLFWLDYDDLFKNWGGRWGIENELEMTAGEMWSRIDEEGAEFWANLRPFNWACDLHTMCKMTAPTTLLTSPSLHHSCAAGKVQWIQKFAGRKYRNFLIGPDKVSCARPGAVLIDDRPKNCEKFELPGGSAILFPRPWNENRKYVGDEMGFVRRSLAGLMGVTA